MNCSGYWESHLLFNTDAPTPGCTVRLISSALDVYVRHVELFIWHLAWHVIRLEDLSLLRICKSTCQGEISPFLLLSQDFIYPAVAWFVSRPSHLKWTSLVFQHRIFPLEWRLVFRSCNYVFPSLECRRSDLLGDLGQTTGLFFLFPSDMYAAYLYWKLLGAGTWSRLLKLLQNIWELC